MSSSDKAKISLSTDPGQSEASSPAKKVLEHHEAFALCSLFTLAFAQTFEYLASTMEDRSWHSAYESASSELDDYFTFLGMPPSNFTSLKHLPLDIGFNQSATLSHYVTKFTEALEDSGHSLKDETYQQLIVERVLKALVYSGGHLRYTARARLAMKVLVRWLHIAPTTLFQVEQRVARDLIDFAASEEEQRNHALGQKESPGSKLKYGLAVGAAALGGGALLGITGGLAAPAIAGALSSLLGTAGLATASALVASSTLALTATSAVGFGLYGANEVAGKVARRVGGVKHIYLRTIPEKIEPPVPLPARFAKRMMPGVGDIPVVGGGLQSLSKIISHSRTASLSSSPARPGQPQAQVPRTASKDSVQEPSQPEDKRPPFSLASLSLSDLVPSALKAPPSSSTSSAPPPAPPSDSEDAGDSSEFSLARALIDSLKLRSSPPSSTATSSNEPPRPAPASAPLPPLASTADPSLPLPDESQDEGEDESEASGPSNPSAPSAAASVSLPAPSPSDLTPEEKERRRLALTIGISGWAWDPRQFYQPWQGLLRRGPRGAEYICMVWEERHVLALGNTIIDFVRSKIYNQITNFIARELLDTFWAAVTLPLKMLSYTNFIDSTWAIVNKRSQKAGVVLGRLIHQGVLGYRPVTLVGYSFGAAVIFHALLELERLGALDRVEHAFLLGAPLPCDKDTWTKARRAVAGRLVNAYSRHDLLLGLIHRVKTLAFTAAGIQPVGVEGVEDVSLSRVIEGHLDYPDKMEEVLEAVNI